MIWSGTGKEREQVAGKWMGFINIAQSSFRKKEGCIMDEDESSRKIQLESNFL
jgi:hypothetical protein